MRYLSGLFAPLLAATVAGGALLPAAAAQGGGFTAYDLYYVGYQGGTPPDGLVRIDPLTGDGALLKKFIGCIFGMESLSYDSYRQRLVLVARLSPSDPGWTTYFTDAAGNFAPVMTSPNGWTALSPTGDGRIYFRDGVIDAQPFKWLDAANQLHVLYAADGVTPFTLVGASSVEDMHFVPSENALILVATHPALACAGGIAQAVHLRKLPLSADGTRVAGPVSCGEFDFDPTDGETTHGLSLMPDGDLLLGGHNGHYGAPYLPRMMRVDPATLAVTPFALIGDDGNGGTTWSTALNKGVLLDYGESALRAYADGAVNGGTVVPSPFSFPALRCALEEIPSPACDGGWIAYGTGLAGKGGFVPRLYGQGCPAPGSTFTVRVDQVVGGGAGVVWVGLTQAAVPFKGGTFHIGAIALTVSLAMGGTPGLAGAGSLAPSATLPANPALTGLSIFLQGAFQDAAAIKGVSLTQGLEIEIG